MARTPEGRIKAKLDEMLKRENVWFFSPQAGPYGRSGVPDRIACVEGHMIGIECKADPSKKPTALQQKCMREIAAAGGTVFVVASLEGVENVQSYIRALRIEKALRRDPYGED